MGKKMQHTGREARSNARLNAVQAAYQLLAGDAPASRVIDEFLKYRIGQEQDGIVLGEADQELFTDILRGIDARGDEIAAILNDYMPQNRPLASQEKLLQAILQCAVYELLARIDVPAAVVINEYLDVAHAFYAGTEPRFINGVLDKAARRLRDAEMKK